MKMLEGNGDIHPVLMKGSLNNDCTPIRLKKVSFEVLIW